MQFNLLKPDDMNILFDEYGTTFAKDVLSLTIGFYVNLIFSKSEPSYRLREITSMKQRVQKAIDNDDDEALKRMYSMMYNAFYTHDLKNVTKKSKHLTTTSIERKPFEVWNVDTQSVEKDRKKKKSTRSKRKVCKCKK